MKIRALREESGLSLNKLADLAKINSGTLSKIERDIKKPTLDQEVAIWQTLVNHLPEKRVRDVKKLLGEDFKDAIEWNLDIEIKPGDRVLVKPLSGKDYVAAVGDSESVHEYAKLQELTQKDMSERHRKHVDKRWVGVAVAGVFIIAAILYFML